jgi:8-amino-7-oxononanoate synthase
MASETPIQPLLCGDDHRAVAMSQALEQAGWLVGAIRPPTVPEGKARLRVTLSALHTRSRCVAWSKPSPARAIASTWPCAKPRHRRCLPLPEPAVVSPCISKSPARGRTWY